MLTLKCARATARCVVAFAFGKSQMLKAAGGLVARFVVAKLNVVWLLRSANAMESMRLSSIDYSRCNRDNVPFAM